MSNISPLLFCVGMMCIAVFFCSSVWHEEIPNGRKDHLAFGLPASPWYDKKVTVTKQGVADSGVQMVRELFVTDTNVYTWSTLFPVLGIVLMVTGRYFKRPREHHEKT